MGPDGFLRVDSASLAAGGYGHGSFLLNPAGDRIRLQSDSSHYWFTDGVVFPVPGRQSGAPLPPPLGSAARLNLGGSEQFITWYIDSTPTSGANNDDYSSVSGTVTWAPSRNFYLVQVVVSGPMGGSFSGVVARYQPYLAPGLSAGRYEVRAIGQPGNVVVAYPDSIDVGYSATLSGISLDFDPEAIGESSQPQVSSGKLAATILPGASIAKRLASSVVFDPMGRRVLNPRSGVFFVSEPSAAGSRASAVTKVAVPR